MPDQLFREINAPLLINKAKTLSHFERVFYCLVVNKADL